MNPLILLGAIPSALAVGALAWLLHTVDVDRIEARQRTALTEQAAQLQEQCTKTIKEAEANNAQYETNINDLNDSYDRTVSALGLCKRETIKLRSDNATSRLGQANTAGRLVHGDVADIGSLLAYARTCRDIQIGFISVKKAWPSGQ